MAKLIDLTGQVFGSWTVVERAENYITEKGNSFVRWLCECKCGSREKVWASNLRRGASTRCTKCAFPTEDLTGKRFSRLVVLKRKDKVDPRTKRAQPAWICKCDCGGETWATSSNLKSSVGSCGCISRELVKGSTNKDRRSLLVSKCYKEYESGAKVRGIPFYLTIKEFESLIKKPCAYCGKKESNLMEDKHRATGGVVYNSDIVLNYNGVDRIDNSKGYHLDNCNPCCFMCNKMKAGKTLEEFKRHVNQIKKHIEHAPEYDGHKPGDVGRLLSLYKEGQNENN